MDVSFFDGFAKATTFKTPKYNFTFPYLSFILNNLTYLNKKLYICLTKNKIS